MPFRNSSDSDDIQKRLHSHSFRNNEKFRKHRNRSSSIDDDIYAKYNMSEKNRKEMFQDEFYIKPKLVEPYRRDKVINRIQHLKEDEYDSTKYKRNERNLDDEMKQIKKGDRAHKNRDSERRESRKHKKSRERKVKQKRDKYQSKSKKDRKKRKDLIEEAEEDSSDESNGNMNNDSEDSDYDISMKLLDDPIEQNDQPTIDDQDISISSIIEKNLDKILVSGKEVGGSDREYVSEIGDDSLHESLFYEGNKVGEPDFNNFDYYNVRSKFESSSRHSDNDFYDNDSRYSLSDSNSSSSSESFGSSISSSRNPKKRRKRSKSKSKREKEDVLVFSPVIESEINIEETVDNRPFYFPAVQGCRLVEEFECLNKIEEGTYGVVFRARDRKTNEIVALKRLKMEKERDGFPITSLREINTLMKARHENIVTVREVVVGSNMDKIYLVMDFIEHDLKSLMLSMVKPFEICEVKCLMLQLLRAVSHLHDNWILHRDLKTSNLLLSHKGILKVADFGLAREYGSPLKNYTRVVVTLWYRAPELLLGTKTYSTQIDMWSVGCIFGELLLMAPLFPGKSEPEQISLLFKELGTPNEKIWPGVSKLPNIKKFEFGKYEYNRLGKRFGMTLSETGLELLNRFLAYCPDRRITADDALKHSYFNESPKAISSEMFPTRPAKSEGGIPVRSKLYSSPKPPSGGQGVNRLNDDSRLFIH